MTKLIEIGLNSSNGPALIKLEDLLKPILAKELLRLNVDQRMGPPAPPYTLTVGDSWRCFYYENKITRDNEYNRLTRIITENLNPVKKSWWDIWNWCKA